MNNRRSLTAWLPSYSDAQRFLRIIEGTRFARLKALTDKVWDKTGTPQDSVDWSDPGKWIPERLDGDSLMLAQRLWEESETTINPRYLGGLISLCKTHKLIEFSEDTISVSDSGRSFLNEEPAQLARMDDYDGILVILSEVAARGPAQRKHILPAFRLFCHTNTTWRAEGSVKDALGRRLDNLYQRDLIERKGRSYRITIFGLDYLDQFGALTIDGNRTASFRRDGTSDPRENLVNSILRLADQQSEVAREQLRNHLQSMDPYQFEHLIKLLLEEMNYDSVQVTSASNDKGVDVTAEFEMGITKVNEVVQVKRLKSNVQRPVLDSLRGSLHRFDAVRGTIITTSGFSRGAREAALERGAAPITLIDGERLLDLLIEYKLGIRSRTISVLEFDAASLSEFASDENSDSEPFESEEES